MPVWQKDNLSLIPVSQAGVAEPGGGGGQGGHGPPKNLSGWAKVCFGPPIILTTAPPPPHQNGQPVVKLLAKLLLRTLKCAKFSKFFACGGLIWVEIIPQVISCFFRANIFT